jgi:hypothetical protein
MIAAAALGTLLMAGQAWAVPEPSEVQTSIQIANTTTSTQSLVGTPNLSGTLNPAAASSILASATYSTTSTTYETSDAGGLTYGKCSFKWSTIWNTGAFPNTSNGYYSFTATATPAADCTVTTLSATTTGQHSLKFTITH